MEKAVIDITANAQWTSDCGGKQDLDFNFIDCNTRYWADFSAQCGIKFMNTFCSTTGQYTKENSPSFYLAESPIMQGTSETDIKAKVKQWYNENIIAATEKALKILRNGNNT